MYPRRVKANRDIIVANYYDIGKDKVFCYKDKWYTAVNEDYGNYIISDCENGQTTCDLDKNKFYPYEKRYYTIKPDGSWGYMKETDFQLGTKVEVIWEVDQVHGTIEYGNPPF